MSGNNFATGVDTGTGVAVDWPRNQRSEDEMMTYRLVYIEGLQTRTHFEFDAPTLAQAAEIAVRNMCTPDLMLQCVSTREVFAQPDLDRIFAGEVTV